LQISLQFTKIYRKRWSKFKGLQVNQFEGFLFGGFCRLAASC